MGLDDEEDNDLYGKAKGNATKACANCGTLTTFPLNATGERAHLGWCPNCFRKRNADENTERRGEIGRKHLPDGRK